MSSLLAPAHNSSIWCALTLVSWLVFLLLLATTLAILNLHLIFSHLIALIWIDLKAPTQLIQIKRHVHFRSCTLLLHWLNLWKCLVGLIYQDALPRHRTAPPICRHHCGQLSISFDVSVHVLLVLLRLIRMLCVWVRKACFLIVLYTQTANLSFLMIARFVLCPLSGTLTVALIDLHINPKWALICFLY